MLWAVGARCFRLRAQTVAGQSMGSGDVTTMSLNKNTRATRSLTPHYSINMRSFGTKSSGNRMPAGELTEEQRVYCLAQVDAGGK